MVLNFFGVYIYKVRRSLRAPTRSIQRQKGAIKIEKKKVEQELRKDKNAGF